MGSVQAANGTQSRVSLLPQDLHQAPRGAPLSLRAWATPGAISEQGEGPAGPALPSSIGHPSL